MFGKKRMVATKKGIKFTPETKRESFLPSDKAWLDTNPKIEPDEFLGRGIEGAVYTVKGNNKLVIKVPLTYRSAGSTKSLTPSERKRRMQIEGEDKDIYNEWQTYEGLSLEAEPLIIPSKLVHATGSKMKGSFPGVVKPRVKIIGNIYKGYRPTDAEFEQIRQKLIALSARGITLVDGLQIGKDRAGRIQLYDLGFIEDRTPKRAAQKNQIQWEMFLRQFGKSVAQYGMINPSGCGDARYLS